MRTKVRPLGVVAVSMILGSTLTGCAAVDQVRTVVGAANTLADFSDRLGKSGQLTFTAKYRTADGPTVTLVQQPPSSAYVSQDGRYAATPEYLLLCDKKSCTRSPNPGGAAAAGAGASLAGVAGPGFVTPELALGLIAAAAVVPGAHISKSSRTIAGQHALCAQATGLDTMATPGEDAVRDFAVCITDAGVLASFSGSRQSGERISVELAEYATHVDPAAFGPPAGIEVVEVDRLPTG